MSVSLLFWFLYIVGFVFSGWDAFNTRTPIAWGGLLVYVLIGLLGFAEFGFHLSR